MNKLTPRPHQLAAVDAITKELSINDRTTVVMACGSGKTLVALWAAKELKANNILILLPSLALISQVLKTWMQEGNWNSSNTLCICSDDTVGDDAFIIDRSELDFPVTTDKKIVEQFLNKNMEHKIVFSTYQSCHLIPSTFKFDLGIFDEAHKTAGNKDKQFSYSLTNKNINISKRLYMTATPKHINVNKTDKNGEKIAAYSMDNEAIYGKVCYKLSFADAVKQDIICGYKVIISVLTSNDINRDLIKHGVTNIKKNKIHTKNIAHALALNNATKENNIKKVFTFHNTVKEARNFSAILGSFLLNKDFKSIHINGKMNSVERGSILSDFKDANQAVLSNARCLTEGVDIPAVDMVAFMSPKKGEIDIIQAVGRAMRKYNGKKDGYVLVPIFLEGKTEDIEDALNDTKYNYIWNILQYMQEYDGDLANIITDMRKTSVRENRIHTADYERLSKKIDIQVIGSEIQLNTLQRSILTKVISKLSSLWDKRFEELLVYKEENGNVNVPQIYKENTALGNWVNGQRFAFRMKYISQERINKLNSVGFVWNTIENAWNQHFNELLNFKNKYGHVNVPYSKKNKTPLSAWIRKQRKEYRRQKLSQKKIDKLNSIGFNWGPYDALWNKNIEEFKNFKSKYGHTEVPVKDKNGKTISLGKWLTKIRSYLKSGKLSQDKIYILNSLGINWNPQESQWDKLFNKLLRYKARYNKIAVSAVKGKYQTLGRWIIKQRLARKQGKLSQDRIDKLNSIGFIWRIKKESK